MERRWGNRLVLDETVVVRRESSVVGSACLHEVSLSGAFLKARWRLPQLARVHVELTETTAGTRGQHVERVEAFVVRHCPDGVGLEWCEFAPDCIARLMEQHHPRFAKPQTQPQELHATGHRRR